MSAISSTGCELIRATARPSTTRSDIGRIWRGSRNAAGSTEFSWPTSSAFTTSTAAAPRRRSSTPSRSGQRPDDGGACDGGGHRAYRFRRHRQPDLRAAVSVRPSHVDVGPLNRRPGRLEHRDRLSRQRSTRHGFDRPARPRWSVRRRRRVHVRRLSVVGGELGRRRRAARQEEPYLRRSRQGSLCAARRTTLSG